MFQTAQNYGFWNFDFWFLSSQKKAIISLSPTQYYPLVLNLFVTLQQSDSSVDGKNDELLSWNLQV